MTSHRKLLGRRRFLGVCAGVVGMAVGLPSYAWLVEPRWIELVRRAIHLPGLPPAFDGLRLVLLSDIHHGPYLDEDRVIEVVKLAAGLEADLILLLGDYAYRWPRFVSPVCRHLARLVRPGGPTVLAVLGNHDGWMGNEMVTAELAAGGVTVLNNDSHPLVRGKDVLWVAGVEDLWTGRPDLRRALLPVRRRETVLLLTHNPDFAEKVTDRRVKLILAGHTHGGQVCLPFLGALGLSSRYGQKYRSGLIVDGWRRTYVTRGVGVVYPPVRFLCRPEVTLLTLRAVEDVSSPPTL